MKNKPYSLLIAILILFGVLTFSSPQVSAQSPTSTPTAKVIRQVNTPAPGDEVLSFFQIGQKDIQLLGPLDYKAMVFGLPADWKVTNSIEITLFIDVSFDNLGPIIVDGQEVVNSGGLLSMEFNREEIGTFPISQPGETMIRVQVPMAFLDSIRDDGRQELTFTFDSGLSCIVEQQMSIVISDSSYIRIPHTTVLPTTDLTRFPFPLYQDSVYPDVASVLIPDQPTAEELQSAMTLIAGLSNRTGGNLAMDLVPYSEFDPQLTGKNNLILVGKTASIPLLSRLKLPLAPTAGSFQTTGGTADDGIVQMVNSPWDNARVVLLVSGNTDQAVVKAAQAVSTGHLRPNTAPNLSVIRDVHEDVQLPSPDIDQTLLDLGYETEVLDRRGVDSAVYTFLIPSGWTTGPDAYFELAFGNSALLDYERSGLNIEVNGQAIGSVRFTEETSSQSVNRVRFNIPSSVITQGVNTLEVLASLQPLDNCSSSQLRGIWANVWSDSRLHLPLMQTTVAPTNTYNLSVYPAPFVFDPSLESLALILEKDNLDAWRSAANISAYLGKRSNGAVTLLQTHFADNVPEETRQEKHLLIIGNALRMPIVSELNKKLPAPFDDGSGLASENNMLVDFRIPLDSPIGYIELLQSPWNRERIIVAALGNTPQGVSWAASGLYDSKLRSQLAGNFAVINGNQVTTTDTRLAPPAVATASSANDAEINIVTPEAPQNPPPARPAWLLPALEASIGLTLLVGIVALVASFRRNKKLGDIASPFDDDDYPA